MNMPPQKSAGRRHQAQRMAVSRWRSHGIAYIEVLLSSIIMAVLIVSAMKLFANLGRSRQSVVGQEAANYLALQMIEEIKQQHYADPEMAGGSGLGADEVGTTRELYDDVDDYHEWSSRPPQDRDGNFLNQYADLLRQVEVNYVAANDFTLVVGSDEGFKRVVITISRQDYEGEEEILEQQVYVIPDTPGVMHR